MLPSTWMVPSKIETGASPSTGKASADEIEKPMNIQLQGLTFKAHSPSDLELVSVTNDIDDPTASVRVRYNGLRWFIDYKAKNTHVTRIFPSRDAAIALIAARAP